MNIEERHLSKGGYQIVGDTTYGKGRINARARELGLKQIFLHAFRVYLWHSYLGKNIEIVCPIPENLISFLKEMPEPPSQETLDMLSNQSVRIFE